MSRSGGLSALILGIGSLLACDEATLSLFPKAEGGDTAPVAGRSGASVAGDANASSGGIGAAGSSGGAQAGASGSTAKGLVGQWPLDGDTKDVVGANDGTLQGTASFVTDASRGQVLRCDGKSPGFAVANLTTSSFTYAFWVWTDTPSNQSGGALEGNALLWANTVGAIDDFTLSLMKNRLDYIGYAQTTAGSSNLVDGMWHHVAVTREDGSSVFLYVDGVQDGTCRAGSGPVTSTPQVYVGGNPIDHYYFTGLIDDLRQYDRALGADEVQTLFTTTVLP
jgi:Concanavalin A-like lectin/glucanases superfamily